MNLLYLSDSILPSRSANSIHVMKMCSAFVSNNNTVTLVAPNYPEHLYEKDVDDVFEYYGVSPCFSILTPKRPYYRNFFSYIFSTLIYVVAIIKIIKNQRPEIVYGRYLPGCLAAALMGYPTIYESHGLVWQATLENILFRILVRSSGFQYIIVISQALKNLYLTHTALPASRIEVAHDSSDPVPDFEALIQWPGRPSALQIGYFGSLYAGRGINLIMQLAELLPGMDFHIVGGSRDEAVSLQKARRLPNLFFHGYIAPSLLYQYRNGCDVLLAPYGDKVNVFGGAGDTSSFMSPLKVFEYMASKRALIASDLPVLREVLDDTNSILVPARDVETWREALIRLDNDPKFRTKIAGNAYSTFLRLYTWKKRAGQVLSTIVTATKEKS